MLLSYNLQIDSFTCVLIFISFSSLIAKSMTSSKILNRDDENHHFALLIILWKKDYILTHH